MSLVNRVPGVALSCFIAGVALTVAGYAPSFGGPILIALGVGVLARNALPFPEVLLTGVDYASKHILRWGIVLLGARMSLGDIVAIGASGVAAILLCMVAAFLIVAGVAKLSGLERDLAVLLAVGTAVCGNSAIAATAPVLDSDQQDIAMAMGTITLLGTAAFVSFPLIGISLDMTDATYGMWVGMSVNDTSQVVAAAAAVSESALESATIVKLVRNAMMAPLIVAIFFWARRSQAGRSKDSGSARAAVGNAIPLFVLGFLTLAALQSMGVLTAPVSSWLGSYSSLLITIAMAGIGMSVDIRALRRIGLRPLGVGLTASSGVAVLAAGLANIVS